MCKVQKLVMPVFPRLSRRRALLTRNPLSSTGPEWPQIVERIAGAKILGPVTIGIDFPLSPEDDDSETEPPLEICADCVEATRKLVLSELQSWDTYVRPNPWVYPHEHLESHLFSNAGRTIKKVDAFFSGIPWACCAEHALKRGKRRRPRNSFIGRIFVEFQDVSLQIDFKQE